MGPARSRLPAFHEKYFGRTLSDPQRPGGRFVGMKVCIEGAEFQPGNNGVRALAVGSVQAILHRYPEAEVFFLNYEKMPVTHTIELPHRQLTVPLINMRFSWRFWLSNNIAF